MSGAALTLRQTGALARRSVVDTLRLPQAWIPSIFFPLVLMAIFTGSFGARFGDVPGFPDVPSFLDFAIAGAIIQGILIGGTSAGAAFATDIEGGFFDRLVASPVSRGAILVGRLAGSVVLALAQALLFVVVAAIFGANIHGGVLGLGIVLLIAAVLAAAVGGLGVFLALRTGSAEAVQGTFPLFFALMFFSSAFFPRETMSGWFAGVAAANPVSYLAEGMREQILNGADTTRTVTALGLSVLLAAITIGASAMAFRRRLRRG